MYINRLMENRIKKLTNTYPVIMVCGARQVGKSTMLNHIKEESRNYVSLDDLNERKLAIDDPMLFLEVHGTPLIIDEFQYAPNLLSFIKLIIDKKH